MESILVHVPHAGLVSRKIRISGIFKSQPFTILLVLTKKEFVRLIYMKMAKVELFSLFLGSVAFIGSWVYADEIKTHVINPTEIKHCNETIPKEIRLPKIRSGVDYTIYETRMDAAYGKNPKLFEELFKQHVADYNNISGAIIHFPSGPKHVYRSAMLAYSPDTLKELVQERGLKTIIHLSNKKTVDQKAWTTREKEIFFSLGGKKEKYIHILDFDYIFNDNDELFAGQKKIAEIIKLIEKSEGPVLIHCLGGEHKTELVFEIMLKHYNNVSMQNITERYKCHTAYTTDPNKKSGYKQNNVDFILNYPYELLN